MPITNQYHSAKNGVSNSLLTHMLIDLEKSKRYLDLSGSGAFRSPEQSQRYWLRVWNLDRLRITHHVLLNQVSCQAAAEFILNDIYAGFYADMPLVAQQIERALPAVSRIFPVRLLEVAAAALDLHVLTHEIDEVLSKALCAAGVGERITTEVYTCIYKQANIHQLRLRQIDLSLALAETLDRHNNKKWLFKAFKLARVPAEKAGLAELYLFLKKAFGMLVDTPDMIDVIKDIGYTEKRLSIRLNQGDNPFLSAAYLPLNSFENKCLELEEVGV